MPGLPDLGRSRFSRGVRSVEPGASGAAALPCGAFLLGGAPDPSGRPPRIVPDAGGRPTSPPSVPSPSESDPPWFPNPPSRPVLGRPLAVRCGSRSDHAGPAVDVGDGARRRGTSRGASRRETPKVPGSRLRPLPREPDAGPALVLPYRLRQPGPGRPPLPQGEEEAWRPCIGDSRRAILPRPPPARTRIVIRWEAARSISSVRSSRPDCRPYRPRLRDHVEGERRGPSGRDPPERTPVGECPSSTERAGSPPGRSGRITATDT